MLRRVAIFCASSSGASPIYTLAAQAIAKLLASRNIELVYGGSRIGLMGTLADTCLLEGGRVIGVIPKALVDREVAHPGLTELHIVNTMHERKAMIADLADAFIALPGGYGTWDEFCEVLTWSQLGIHRKPCALLNVNGYYDAFLQLADLATTEGFVRECNREILLSDTDPGPLLDRIASYTVPVGDAIENGCIR
jgi:uncharacterized protein (TIGR00730 family)